MGTLMYCNILRFININWVLLFQAILWYHCLYRWKYNLFKSVVWIICSVCSQTDAGILFALCWIS